MSSEELVRVFGLAESVKKQWQVVVVVKFFDLDFPGDAVAFGIVLQRNREVTALVELSELCRTTLALLEGACRRWTNYFHARLSG